MKTACFTKALTVAFSEEIYLKIKEITDEKRISMGEWVRIAAEKSLADGIILNVWKEDIKMKPENKIQINLSIPERYRNLLRRMAAERVMSDPSEVVTGASIATELLLAALKEISGETKKEGGLLK